MTHIISFPNIGIENLKVNRIAFSILGRDIYWYGVLILTGIICAFCYAMWQSKKEHIKSDDIYDFAIWVVIAGIVGARAYYVLTSLDEYDSFIDTLKIWNGGLGFYGCVIGGAIAAIIVAKIKKIRFPVIFDMVAPALLLAQAIGRWGNFFNAEAYGSVSSWDFFGHVFDISGSIRLPWIMYIGVNPVQPTFLYECIWNLIGFALLTALYKKKRFDGQIFLGYITWYGFARMLIEGFRTDSLYIGNIRISQLVGAVSVIAGITLTAFMLKLAKEGKLPVPFEVKEIPEKTEEITNTEENQNGKAD